MIIDEEDSERHVAPGQYIPRSLSRLAIWKNGRVVPAEDASVQVWDHGLLYGDGVFEGIRMRERRLYRFDAHLGRLRRSARMLGIEVNYQDTEFLAAIGALASANDLRDAHVRIVLTRGIGLPSLDPRHCDTPTTLVLAYPFPPTLGDTPITVSVSSFAKKSPRSIDPALKSLSYVEPVLAKLQAISAGASDAIILDAEGFIAETTGANIFLAHAGVLATPECTSALPGITRRTILELAKIEKIETNIRRITLGELYAADEVFLTGTGAGIVSVQAIDGRNLPDAPGAVTQTLTRRYMDTWTSPQYSVLV